MANHNKNKQFGGTSFERIRQNHSVGQDALMRESQRKQERLRASRHEFEMNDEFFSSYNSDFDD